MSLWSPPKLDLEIVYEQEDLRILADTVCERWGLGTLKRVIENAGYKSSLIKEYVYNISQGIPHETLGIYVTEVPASHQKRHKQLFHILWEIPFKDVPLYVNDDGVIVSILKWRLKVAK